VVTALVFIALAAACNAVMDICSHKWHISIFSNYSRKYWDATISWKNKYNEVDVRYGRVKVKVFGRTFNKHVAFTDSWHLFKSLMIVFIIFSGALVSFVDNELPNVYNALIYFFGGGVVWNATFLLFYKKLLIKR